jgi:hypothetical protein
LLFLPGIEAEGWVTLGSLTSTDFEAGGHVGSPEAADRLKQSYECAHVSDHLFRVDLLRRCSSALRSDPLRFGVFRDTIDPSALPISAEGPKTSIVKLQAPAGTVTSTGAT